MNTIEITCPNCGKQLEHWTEGDFIECTGCRAQIQVEPCAREEENGNAPDGIEVIRVDV